MNASLRGFTVWSSKEIYCLPSLLIPAIVAQSETIHKKTTVYVPKSENVYPLNV